MLLITRDYVDIGEMQGKLVFKNQNLIYLRISGKIYYINYL